VTAFNASPLNNKEINMTFSERMKELLDQGVAVSKDFASKAGEKAQDWSEKGYQASKEFLNKAGAKAQDLGERGVLMMEIRQLEGRAQKLLARLGTEAYNAFVEQGAQSVAATDAGIKPLLDELASIRESIEKREAELQSRKG
jgi:phage terminase small subunit